MGKNSSVLAAVCLSFAAGCGGGGGGTGGAGSGTPQSLTGDLTLRAHEPADGAVQVPLASAVVLHFDGVIVRECLTDTDIWLEPAAGGPRVPGSFAIEGAGRDVRFTPSAPLAAETDYRFHLSPLVGDTAGRILAETREFTFRTLDLRPPALAAAAVQNGAVNVDRLASFTFDFDEPLDPRSVTATAVYLRDAFGRPCPCTVTLAEPQRVVVDPVVDLGGDRAYMLVVAGGNRGVTDRAGNLFAAPWSASFRTAADTAPPRLLAAWPEGGAALSPRVQVRLQFDESIDPASIEAAALRLTDPYGNVQLHQAVTSPDQRALRLVFEKPLQTGLRHTLTVAAGIQAVTDVSGNPLVNGRSLQFTVGSDATPPQRSASLPAQDAERVSIGVAPSVTFDEAIDPASVLPGTVQLLGPAGPLPGSASVAGATIAFTPAALLAPATRHELVIAGGPDGARDLAGNPLPADVRVPFTTTEDATLPGLILLPADGSAAVAIGSCVSAMFDAPIDPATVSEASFQVTTQAGAPVPGRLEVLAADRAVRFRPLAAWTQGAWYRAIVRGGPGGIAEASGNHLGEDAVHDFRIGTRVDVTPPVVRVTVNAAAEARKAGMQVPPWGFTLDVEASDPVDYALDPGSFELEIVGDAGSVERILAVATITRDRLSWRVPASLPMAPGEYQVQARARDLSGNETRTPPLTIQVVNPSAAQLPFERTHVVWVRADLDRDGNGTADFTDDLIKLGLGARGDPAGLNARMTALVRDGVVARTNELLGRDAGGAALGHGAVPIRLSVRQPLGVAHMQIALGGLDPEGPARREYGAESTGVLGRAYFDKYNGQVNDHNIGTRPGLGVFPGEMFLFQAALHRRVYPGYVTTFARRFLPLAPGMGGTPVGLHREDATVVAPGFDYATASGAQRARFDAVFGAADDWAAAIGVILAHEIGHAVGLVAEGPSPLGLHGDASLHNDVSGSADVMAAAVGYDSLVLLNYSYRDLNLAYLRQRLVLR